MEEDPPDEIQRVSARPRGFEDLVVWQRARKLTAHVYRVTKSGHFRTDRSLANQIQRSCVSIMANIDEGFARKGAADFGHHLSIAQGSCAETKSHFYICLDIGYFDEETMQEFISELDDIGRMITRLHQNAARAKLNGK